MTDNDMLQHYADNAFKLYQIEGIEFTIEKYHSTKCTFIEWHMVVGFMLLVAQDYMIPNGDNLINLTKPDYEFYGDGASQACNVILFDDSLLYPLIRKGIADAKATLARFDMTLPDEITESSVEFLIALVGFNPAGIRIKLLDEFIKSGIYKIPFMSDEVEKTKTQTSQTVSEELEGYSFVQRLLGINPSGPEGEELDIEIPYWMAGFSGTCTFATKSVLSDNNLTSAIVETGMKVLLKEKVTIEPPLFDILRDALEDFLLNNKTTLIQIGMKSWENPQVSQYALSNQGKFDEDTLINSMQSLLDFMKANSGFRTE
ncbi:hypothetical protein KAU11_09320 [Candidatus Babeliales bacterium]|nr:hypothetical protein [Candidatus Babeliales bacterium]